MLNKYFALLVFTIALTASCLAHNTKPCCDKSYENYYIQPKRIFLAPNGIYASIDGTLIQINTLCADARGIFVPYDQIITQLEYCPFCQSWYDQEYGHDCDGPRD